MTVCNENTHIHRVFDAQILVGDSPYDLVPLIDVGCKQINQKVLKRMGKPRLPYIF